LGINPRGKGGIGKRGGNQNTTKNNAWSSKIVDQGKKTNEEVNLERLQGLTLLENGGEPEAEAGWEPKGSNGYARGGGGGGPGEEKVLFNKKEGAG